MSHLDESPETDVPRWIYVLGLVVAIVLMAVAQYYLGYGYKEGP